MRALFAALILAAAPAAAQLSAQAQTAQPGQQAKMPQLTSPGGVGSPSAEESVFSLDSFKDCGYISRFAPNKLPADCFQNIDNIVLDKDWTIRRRNGYTAYNATACAGAQSVRGLWPFFGTDGSQYLIVYSSASLFSSKGDGTCTAITGLSGNLSKTANMTCVQAMGYLWCADGVDQPFRTNVVSTDTLVNAPLGFLIGTFRNRIVISNVSGNLTNIYMSGELNGLDWSLPNVTYTTSPVILNVSGTNDGLATTCLMGEFQNQFLIGRKYDLYGLSGYDTRDFALTKISNQIGCIDQNSVQEVNNVKYWLSERGIEGYTGTEITRVSYPIDNNLQAIINAAGNPQSFTVNGQNFTTGNLTASGAGAPISATINPGNIVPSTAAYIDNSTSTFVTGSALVNLSTIAPNNLQEVISSNTILGGDFASSSLWTVPSATLQIVEGVYNNGDFVVCPNSSPGGVTILCPTNASGAVASHCAAIIYSDGSSTDVCGGPTSNAAEATLTVFDGTTGAKLGVDNAMAGPGPGNIADRVAGLQSVSVSSSVFLSPYGIPNNPGCSPLSSCFHNSSATPSGWHVIYDAHMECSKPSNHMCISTTFSNIRVSSYPATATYVSSTFNTGVSTPILSGFNVSLSSNSGQAITYKEAFSSNTVNWTTSTITNGAFPVGHKQYWRYEADFTTNSGTVTAVHQGTSLVASTTGYYITPCITAVGNTAWGNLTVDGVTNGGAFTFWMSTSAVSCAQVTDPAKANWTLQTANSIITVPVSSYTAVRILFSIDAATQTPIVNDLAVNWNAGGNRPPVASSRYNDEYWLFYTSSTAVGNHNDHALVYDQNRHWTSYDDINAYSATIYLNQLYTGDSNATGTIYQQDIGNNDNGANFTMSFQTADLDGGDPMARKDFRSLYMTIGAQNALNANLSVSCNYQLDGSSTTYSLGAYTLSESPDTSGYNIAKFPFPAGQPHNGHWINVSCSNNGNSGPINIYHLRLVYKKESWD